MIFAQAQGINGFLGTRGSLMLDVVFVAMFAVLPVLGASIYLVRQRRYALHKRLQLSIAIVLLAAVLAFELDMQFFTNWEARAEGSPYFDLAHKWTCPVGLALIVHLCFAVPTLLVWIVVTIQALRKFPSPPLPGSHSSAHRLLAWPAAWGIVLTAVTGWIFYVMAFVLTK